MVVENYEFNYNNHIFLLKIYDRIPRFQDEGIMEMITLHINGYEIYCDSFGREKSLIFLTSELDNEFIDITNDVTKKIITFRDYNNGKYIMIKNDDYDIFINWLIESLTSITEKRISKINNIKNKLSQKYKLYYEKY